MKTLAMIRQRLFRLAPDPCLPIVLGQRRIFILPTRAGTLYGIVLLTMLVGAINYNLSLGHALVFLLAGLGFVAMVHTFRNLVDMRIVSVRADPVFAGETLTIRWLVDNPHPYDRRALEFSIGRNPAVRLDLPAKTRGLVDLPYTTERRGRIDPGRVNLSSCYPLGLFRAWCYPHPPVSCLVYPKPVSSPFPPSFAEKSDGLHAGASGHEDFAGLRVRQPTDSPRHIAWKAVARDLDGRPLMVRHFTGGAEEQRWLDWASMPTGLDDEARLSRLCGWVLAAEQQGLCYGLRLPGIEQEPAQGRQHRDRCLEALALYGQAR